MPVDDIFDLTQQGHLFLNYSSFGATQRGYYKIRIDLKDNGNVSCLVANRTLLVMLDNSTATIQSRENIRVGIGLLNSLHELNKSQNDILSMNSLLTNNQKFLVTYVTLSLLVVVVALLLVLAVYFALFKRRSQTVDNTKAKKNPEKSLKTGRRLAPNSIQDEQVSLTQNYDQLTNITCHNNDYLLKPKMMNGSFESTTYSTSSSCTPATTSTITSLSQKKPIRSVLV